MNYYVAGIPYSSDDIYHHGIKGQKWGLRRFQNADGSLTPEGKRRYGQESLGTNSHSLVRKIASRDMGPIGALKNTNIRGHREDRLKNKADELKRQGKDDSKARRAYEAQKQKNIDYEKYTANTSTKKLVAQALVLGGTYNARKYREARARGAGRVRAMASTAFWGTPIGQVATRMAEREHYGAFVHCDSLSDELYHFGIKGQKWGYRRFQNEDGTLTEEGKARYRNNPDAAKKYFKENWVKTYNGAIDESNPKLNVINKKYENVDFNKDDKAYDRYQKEVEDMLNEVMNKHFDNDYAEIFEISGLGKDYLRYHSSDMI